MTESVPAPTGVSGCALTVSSDLEGADPLFEQETQLKGLRRHVVPSTVLDVTREHLRWRGSEGHEGALCWAGIVKEGLAIVTTALPFVASGEWGVHIPAEQTGLLYAHCHARGLTLLAQVHSHPRNAFHSTVDEQLPHSAEPGFLSIVVPNFGRCSYSNFSSWAVFEQLRYEIWREWGNGEKRERLRVLDAVVRIP